MIHLLTFCISRSTAVDTRKHTISPGRIVSNSGLNLDAMFELARASMAMGGMVAVEWGVDDEMWVG